jgi:hypothetical protein
MKISLIILFTIYLYKLFSNRIKLKKKYEDAIVNLDNNIQEILGLESLKNVKDKRIWIGMPECLLKYMNGIPDEIDLRETPNVIYKTWHYNLIPNVRSNAKRKYKTEIYTENYLITHLDILN